MARWVFVMHGGIQPGEMLGPYETEEQERQLILEEMRRNPELLWEDGEDTIHWIETAGDAKPEVGSFMCGFMDDLRWQVEEERKEARDGNVVPAV